MRYTKYIAIVFALISTCVVGAEGSRQSTSLKDSDLLGFCFQYQAAQDTVDVETLLEKMEMEAPRYASSMKELWTTPACRAPLKFDTPVPILFNTANNAPKNEKFPKVVHDYFVDDKKDPQTWLKAINTTTSDGLTFLDFMHYNLARGHYDSVKASKDAALRIVRYLCGTGGVYSKFPVSCNRSEDQGNLAALSKLARQGDAVSQRKLGLATQHGTLGLKSDIASAIRWYTQAADQGDREAIEILANIYYRLGSGGTGLEEDGSKAIKWYEKLGDGYSYFVIGAIYARGLAGVRQSWQDAINAWKKSADLGYVDSIREIAEEYVRAGDFRTAIEWYLKYIDNTKTESGSAARANITVGFLYLQNRGGIPRDYSKAATYFRRSLSATELAWGRIFVVSGDIEKYLGLSGDLEGPFNAWISLARQGNADADFVVNDYRSHQAFQEKLRREKNSNQMFR